MKPTYLFLAFSLLFSQLTVAQESSGDHYMFVELRGHSGVHFYTGEALSSTLESGYGSLEARLGWQTTGANDWEGAYGYPSYGFGWYSGFIGNPEVLGQPNALFGFLSFPISINRRNTFMSDLSLGLTYDLNPYDPDNNPNNDAIGSPVTVYFNLSLGGRYNLNREIDLTYGIDFTHFSNGRTVQPNYGLNMMGAHLGTRYHFNPHQHKVDNGIKPQVLLDVRPDYPTEWSDLSNTDEDNFLLYLAGGTTQNGQDKGTSNRYFNSSVTFEYQHFFNLKNGVVAGLDLFYDGSLTAFDEDPWMYGYHGGYDYRIYRFTMRFIVGGYFSAPERKGGFFMRPAAKWDFNDHIYAQVGLKTLNGGAADWVEYGIGFSF